MTNRVRQGDRHGVNQLECGEKFFVIDPIYMRLEKGPFIFFPSDLSLSLKSKVDPGTPLEYIVDIWYQGGINFTPISVSGICQQDS